MALFYLIPVKLFVRWPTRKRDTTEIIAAEGIETLLSTMQATTKNGVAALPTSGLKNLVIPKETKVIYIAVDSDPVRENKKGSMPGQKASYIMAEKFEKSREGRIAYLVKGAYDSRIISTSAGVYEF